MNKPDYVKVVIGQKYNCAGQLGMLLYGFKSIEEVDKFAKKNKNKCETCKIVFKKKESVPVYTPMLHYDDEDHRYFEFCKEAKPKSVVFENEEGTYYYGVLTSERGDTIDGVILDKPKYIHVCSAKRLNNNPFGIQQGTVLFGFNSMEEVDDFALKNKKTCEVCKIFEFEKDNDTYFSIPDKNNPDEAAPAVNWKCAHTNYLGYYGIVVKSIWWRLKYSQIILIITALS